MFCHWSFQMCVSLCTLPSVSNAFNIIDRKVCFMYYGSWAAFMCCVHCACIWCQISDSLSWWLLDFTSWHIRPSHHFCQVKLGIPRMQWRSPLWSTVLLYVSQYFRIEGTDRCFAYWSDHLKCCISAMKAYQLDVFVSLCWVFLVSIHELCFPVTFLWRIWTVPLSPWCRHDTESPKLGPGLPPETPGLHTGDVNFSKLAAPVMILLCPIKKGEILCKHLYFIHVDHFVEICFHFDTKEKTITLKLLWFTFLPWVLPWHVGGGFGLYTAWNEYLY